MNRDEKDQDLFANKYMSDYGQRLFNHFCAHRNTTWITIRKFKGLPQHLGMSLFGLGYPQVIDLTRVAMLFPNLNELTFNFIDLNQMKVECKSYVAIVRRYLASTPPFTNKLQRVSFVSEPQRHHRENVTLKELNPKALTRHHWEIQYKYQNQDTHSLVFLKVEDILFSMSDNLLMQRFRNIHGQFQMMGKAKSLWQHLRNLSAPKSKKDKSRFSYIFAHLQRETVMCTHYSLKL